MIIYFKHCYGLQEDKFVAGLRGKFRTKSLQLGPDLRSAISLGQDLSRWRSKDSQLVDRAAVASILDFWKEHTDPSLPLPTQLILLEGTLNSVEVQFLNKFNQFASVQLKSRMAALARGEEPTGLFLEHYDLCEELQDYPPKYTFRVDDDPSNFSVVFRNNFDRYFMEVCKELLKRSNCIKMAVGAILVKNNRIISTSYNGSPAENCYEGGCENCWKSRGQETAGGPCFCIHAEYGTILEAGLQRARGCTLYTTMLPCQWCSKIIVAAGVQAVVFQEKNMFDPTCEQSIKKLSSVLQLRQLSL